MKMAFYLIYVSQRSQKFNHVYFRWNKITLSYITFQTAVLQLSVDVVLKNFVLYKIINIQVCIQIFLHSACVQGGAGKCPWFKM